MISAYQVKIEIANKRILSMIVAKNGEEAIEKAMIKGKQTFSNHYVPEIIEKQMKITLTELSNSPVMEGMIELEKENYDLGMKVVRLERELEEWRSRPITKRKEKNG